MAEKNMTEDFIAVLNAGKRLWAALQETEKSDPKTGFPKFETETVHKTYIDNLEHDVSRLQDEAAELLNKNRILEGRNAGLKARNSILEGENSRLKSEISGKGGILSPAHEKDEKIRELQGLVRDLQDQQKADVARIEKLERTQRPIGG